MSYAVTVPAALAVLAAGVIFGTDVLTALVLRPALAELDDAAMAYLVGRTHHYGGRRLSVPGVVSVVAAVLTVAAAALTNRPAAAAPAAVGLAALLGWLVIFNRVSLPINKVFIAASQARTTPPDARALQSRWESVINLRSALQGLALLAFCAAIALA